MATFVGFGFGAIQAGLFLYEAQRSGRFDRLVVAEVMPEVVNAVRAHGAYSLNIATAAAIEQHAVTGIEIYNPADPDDACQLVAAIAEATVLGTALPSVDFYTRGAPSVADLLNEGLARPCVIYTAENNIEAAQHLRAAVTARNVCILNTVIGKMSQVLTDPTRIDRIGLARVAPGLDRAFIVEAFNRILVDQCALPGIDVFEPKADLMPFEEAKLYGHNATHALIGYLAQARGIETMSEALADPKLRAFAREAYLRESGGAIIARHAGVDPLFTPAGYQAYVDDLLVRMANPYLEDRVERIIRDPKRKLGWDDRLIGTMRLALQANIDPQRFAQGAAAALRLLEPHFSADYLRKLWGHTGDEADAVIACIQRAWETPC
jgi:mannitol-1-phosphate 5-dehydrogenase